MTKNKVTLLNIIFNIIQQVTLIISGFIMPKIILSYFGSNVNGLVSSLNQFLTYITLLEGGVTGVITAALYKPLIKKENNKISSILITAKSFYKKIGIIYIIYSIIIAIIYPLFINNKFNFIFVFLLTIILSINLLIQYMFSLTYKTLLISDKKGYIVSITQTIIIILNIILSIVSINVYPSIHILKLISGLLFILQPLVFSYYIKKNYEINNKATKDNELLKNRWNGFSINFASFIHSSTDIAILTLFTNLQTVSIYSVYSLVTYGLKAIIGAISGAIEPTVAHAYAKGDLQELNTKFNLYEYIVFLFVFYFFTIAGLLITPFVMIFTKGINDANYYQPIFGALIILAEAIYVIKYPHLNLSYSANKFKEITIPAFVEALINISVSILLVNNFGLIGVAIGTICGMIYRLLFHVKFTTTLIKGRKQSIFYKKMFVFSITAFIGLIICVLLSGVKFNLLSWIFHGILYILIFGILYLIISLMFFKNEIKYFVNYLKK